MTETINPSELVTRLVSVIDSNLGVSAQSFQFNIETLNKILGYSNRVPDDILFEFIGEMYENNYVVFVMSDTLSCIHLSLADSLVNNDEVLKYLYSQSESNQDIPKSSDSEIVEILDKKHLH